MLLPSTSIAESNSAVDRLDLEESIQKQSEEKLVIKDNPYGPSCILRLLLWLRNLLILGFVGIIVIALKNLFNSSG